MKTLSLSKAREHMSLLADPIEKTILTQKGKPVAVVLGIDAYKSQQAILELANDPVRYSKTLAAHIRVQAGELNNTKDLEELEALLMAQESASGV